MGLFLNIKKKRIDYKAKAPVKTAESTCQGA